MKAFQKRVLRPLLVERLVDVRHDERLDGGREPLDALGGGIEPVGEREVEPVQEVDRALSHHDEQLRLHDVQLAAQPGGRVVGVLGRRT